MQRKGTRKRRKERGGAEKVKKEIYRQGNLSGSISEESTSNDGEKDVEDGEGDEDAQIAPSVVKADAQWVVELISHCVRAGKGR
jgi:hypothetical protein